MSSPLNKKRLSFHFYNVRFLTCYILSQKEKKPLCQNSFITLIFNFNFFGNVGLLLICATKHYLPNPCNDSSKSPVSLTPWDKVHCQLLASTFCRFGNLEIDWTESNNLPLLTFKLFASTIWHLSVLRASQLWCCALDFCCIHWKYFIQKCLILCITIETVNSYKHSKSAPLKKVIPCFLLWL